MYAGTARHPHMWAHSGPTVPPQCPHSAPTVPPQCPHSAPTVPPPAAKRHMGVDSLPTGKAIGCSSGMNSPHIEGELKDWV